MSLLKVIAKPNSKKVLLLLNEKGSLNFGQILKETKLSKSSLSDTLKELHSYNLINIKEEKIDDRIPRKIYSLTERGKKALIIYQLEKELENLKENQTIVINYKIINCKNHNVINANVVNINQK